jgi:uncharacterized protein
MAGEPSFIELGVRDADVARAFYGALLGWQPSGQGGNGRVTTPTLDIGIHGQDQASHFEVFFAVEDLDVSLSLLQDLGGTLNGEVHDDPGFGRWAECTDNQGVRFGLRQPSDT